MTTDDLRTAFIAHRDKHGLTAYRISQLCSVDPRQMDRFIAGGELEISTLIKLLQAVGLELKIASIKGFSPSPSRPRGRPKKNLENSGV